MCFRKDKPVRLHKKEPSLFDDLKFLLSIPEVWIAIVFIVLFILMIHLAMGETSWYYITKV